MKTFTVFKLFIILSVLSPASTFGNHSDTMSEEQKQASLNNLKNYKQTNFTASERSTQNNIEHFEEECIDQISPQSEFCHRQKYIDGDFLIVEIHFSRDQQFPVQPRTKFVPGAGPYGRDTSERDAFLSEWSDKVFRYYLGEDYIRFSKTELLAINKNYVILTISVLDPSELDEVIENQEITYIKHIQDPIVILDELK